MQLAPNAFKLGADQLVLIPTRTQYRVVGTGTSWLETP